MKMIKDERYWEEVRRAIGRGTWSILFGTSTRALNRSLEKLMTEKCRLDDDGLGPEVHAIEAGKDPQALLVRVGPVFYEDRPAEIGVWIEYQHHYSKSSLFGPVLLTPQVWQELVKSVQSRLDRRTSPLWKRILARI
jgi:hypothetical protein